MTTNAPRPTVSIVPLPEPRRRKPSLAKRKDRFVVQTFVNRSGTASRRMSGTKRDGNRVRENYEDVQAAECRRIELEGEYHAATAETTLRATRLTHEQIQLAEVAYI